MALPYQLKKASILSVCLRQEIVYGQKKASIIPGCLAFLVEKFVRLSFESVNQKAKLRDDFNEQREEREEK